MLSSVDSKHIQVRHLTQSNAIFSIDSKHIRVRHLAANAIISI